MENFKNFPFKKLFVFKKEVSTLFANTLLSCFIKNNYQFFLVFFFLAKFANESFWYHQIQNYTAYTNKNNNSNHFLLPLPSFSFIMKEKGRKRRKFPLPFQFCFFFEKEKEEKRKKSSPLSFLFLFCHEGKEGKEEEKERRI
jgi:hypothetical protein